MTNDLRKYTKDTRTRLVIGFLLMVFLVGDGLIFLFYGKECRFICSGLYAGCVNTSIVGYTISMDRRQDSKEKQVEP